MQVLQSEGFQKFIFWLNKTLILLNLGYRGILAKNFYWFSFDMHAFSINITFMDILSIRFPKSKSYFNHICEPHFCVSTVKLIDSPNSCPKLMILAIYHVQISQLSSFWYPLPTHSNQPWVKSLNFLYFLPQIEKHDAYEKNMYITALFFSLLMRSFFTQLKVVYRWIFSTDYLEICFWDRFFDYTEINCSFC